MDNKDKDLIEYERNTELGEILEVADDQDFESRLAAYDGPGDKDYARVTPKRINDASNAYALIEQADSALVDALNLLGQANTGTTRIRALSIAITNIEQGMLWMNNVAYAVAPHDMNSTDPIAN